jgi:hypothetical protein
MKEIIIAILSFVASYGMGVTVYYSGNPQIGENIAMVSLTGLAMWGFGFYAVHTPSAEG